MRFREDRGCNGGATAVLKGSFEVSGDHDGVRREFEGSTSLVNTPVNTGGVEAELD